MLTGTVKVITEVTADIATTVRDTAAKANIGTQQQHF